MCYALNRRSLCLMVGWLHLFSSTALSLTIVLLLYIYYSESKGGGMPEEELILGMDTYHWIFILGLCVADFVFSVLLLKGITTDNHRLMTPFVCGNYVALGFLIVITIIYFVEDMVEATLNTLITDLLTNISWFGLTLLVFFPVHRLYHKIRHYPDHMGPYTYQTTVITNGIYHARP